MIILVSNFTFLVAVVHCFLTQNGKVNKILHYDYVIAIEQKNCISCNKTLEMLIHSPWVRLFVIVTTFVQRVLQAYE
jgi:hypothetical protein